MHICRLYKCTTCKAKNTSGSVIHCNPDCVAITKTCRQINAETTLLPVMLNTFCGFSYDILSSLDSLLSQAQSDSVESICVLANYRLSLKGYRTLLGLKKVKIASALRGIFYPGTTERIVANKMIVELSCSGAGSHVEIITDKELQDICSGWLKLP